VNRTELTPRGLMRAEALQALREAVWDVIQEHKRTGLPLISWREGKVVHVSPEEAEAEYLAAKARAEREEGIVAPPQTRNSA
jgi:hypothetical protein